MIESTRRLANFTHTSQAEPIGFKKRVVTKIYRAAMEWSKKHPNPICFNRGRPKQTSK